ncbi:MAG: hypothetical protein PHH75_06810 [Candidatus Omnitrophica bacterium]|nr:hypothetical protein [Candidatus Omnitrophota bacterium]MDD5574873.1 hypothetical protein [Candidatus Omnitrophota bacterium]
MRRLILMCCAYLFVSSMAFADDAMMGGCAMMKKADAMGAEDKFHMKAFYLLANADEIGLTDDQVKTIEDLKLKVKKNLIMKDAEINTLGLDIAAALKEDEVDMKRVNALVDKKYDLKKQRTKDAIQGYIDLRGILTNEQREKLKETWSQCMMGKKKMMMSGEHGESSSKSGKMESMHAMQMEKGSR